MTEDDQHFLTWLRRIRRPIWRGIYSSPRDNGVRDVDSPCGAFQHGKPAGDSRTGCTGDGHYLCGECRLHDGTVLD